MDALEHQREALEEITRRARAYFAGTWRDLPIQPRWTSLLVGPTGAGKTAVAAMAAEAVGASMLRISAQNWMPSGAHNRCTKETISVIAEHVARNNRTILFADEADKFMNQQQGDTSWKNYILGELFDIIDGRWPTGLNSPSGETDDNDFPREIPITELTTKLRNTVFILAAGTFQSWYDDSLSRRAMGFGSEIDPPPDKLSADIIAEKLPRELANRFNSSIIRLPELQPPDYHRIAKEAENKLPERLRASFQVEIAKRIPGAIAAKKGVRFLEEAIMEVLKNQPPTSQEPPFKPLKPTHEINTPTP